MFCVCLSLVSYERFLLVGYTSMASPPSCDYKDQGASAGGYDYAADEMQYYQNGGNEPEMKYNDNGGRMSASPSDTYPGGRPHRAGGQNNGPHQTYHPYKRWMFIIC